MTLLTTMASTSPGAWPERSKSSRAARAARSMVPSPSRQKRRSPKPMKRRTQRSLVWKSLSSSGLSSPAPSAFRRARRRMRSRRSRAATRALLHVSSGAYAERPSRRIPETLELTRVLHRVRATHHSLAGAVYLKSARAVAATVTPSSSGNGYSRPPWRPPRDETGPLARSPNPAAATHRPGESAGIQPGRPVQFRSIQGPSNLPHG